MVGDTIPHVEEPSAIRDKVADALRWRSTRNDRVSSKRRPLPRDVHIGDLALGQDGGLGQITTLQRPDGKAPGCWHLLQRPQTKMHDGTTWICACLGGVSDLRLSIGSGATAEKVMADGRDEHMERGGWYEAHMELRAGEAGKWIQQPPGYTH
ncbi:hypothetical protein NDU88_010727 [Pleurodeles waltl]|uniref:Uncharacterized protein n=1 Tax=Pleurodeles waltl TaxID=8319 RepID=A0AAV7PYW7_PLEWA|nr:hypothetical protein NDU88_010727 [Pleurodeles waltl]